MLAFAWEASSAWQVEHWTFGRLAGCGKSLTVVWQSVQPRIPCWLAEWRAGPMEMLLPLSDFIPAWPWQPRQVSSCFSGWADFAGADSVLARTETGISAKNK